MNKIKKLLGIAILSILPVVLHATVLVNDAGPYFGASFSGNWVAVCGFNIGSSGAPFGTNNVTYTVAVVAHGSPVGTNSYLLNIKVTDSTNGSTYYTQFGSIPATGASYTVGAPAGHPYNVTFWVSCNQSGAGSGSQNYWTAVLTDIQISN